MRGAFSGAEAVNAHRKSRLPLGARDKILIVGGRQAFVADENNLEQILLNPGHILRL
jgi:hypothetical protein